MTRFGEKAWYGQLVVLLIFSVTVSFGIWAVGNATLSPAQKAAIEKYGIGGTIESVKREHEDGLEVFTVLQKAGSRTLEIQVTKDGELNATEEKIKTDELPPVVEKVARKYLPKGLKEAEKSVITVYEVEGRDSEGHRREIRITRPGIVLLPAGQPGSQRENKPDND